MVDLNKIQKIKDVMVYDIKNKMLELDVQGIEYESQLGIFINRDTLGNLDFFTLKSVHDWIKNYGN